MAHDGIDISSRICPSKNKADFTNCSVDDITALLLELVCIDRQLINISISDHFLAHLTGFAVIELTIGIHAFVHVLKQRMAKNIERFIMLMIPNERDQLTIIIDKCIFHDCTPIRALHISSSGPSAEITIVDINFHFDFSSFSMEFVYVFTSTAIV